MVGTEVVEASPAHGRRLELDGLSGLFQPKPLQDSVILCFLHCGSRAQCVQAVLDVSVASCESQFSHWTAGDFQNHQNLGTAEICCSWSQGSGCRVPSTNQWLQCKQDLACAEQLLGFSMVFNLFGFIELYIFFFYCFQYFLLWCNSSASK